MWVARIKNESWRESRLESDPIRTLGESLWREQSRRESRQTSWRDWNVKHNVPKPKIRKKYTFLIYVISTFIIIIGVGWGSRLKPEKTVCKTFQIIFFQRTFWTIIYYCNQIARWILNLNFPGFSKLKFFFSISWYYC